MSKKSTLSISTVLLSGLFLITSCGSSGGGDNGTTDGGGGPATVPANAIIIDSSNAEATVLAAASAASGFDSALGVQATQVVGLNTALDIIMPLIKNHGGNSGIDLAAGVAVNVTEACNNGGSTSIVGNETDNGATSSGTITVTFNNCNELGIIINGSITATFSDDFNTGAYSVGLTGSFSVLTSGQSSITVSMTGIIFKETGNDFDGTYTTTEFTYALNFVSNGSGSGGFLVQLLAPVVESNGDNCPESGHILITGANGTTAEGIFNGDSSSFTVKANGTIVNANALCI